MIDRAEQIRRGISPRRKASSHPYAAIEHRVIDSHAFADLTGGAVRVLLVVARQHDGRNNGHLHAAYSYMRKRGIGSEHTLQSAIDQLIAHGLLYRTRSHGANGVWARYALTWLPIHDTKELHLGGWKRDAWRDWQPPEKKAPGKKCRTFAAKTADSPIDFLQ